MTPEQISYFDAEMLRLLNTSEFASNTFEVTSRRARKFTSAEAVQEVLTDAKKVRNNFLAGEDYVNVIANFIKETGRIFSNNGDRLRHEKFADLSKSFPDSFRLATDIFRSNNSPSPSQIAESVKEIIESGVERSGISGGRTNWSRQVLQRTLMFMWPNDWIEIGPKMRGIATKALFGPTAKIPENDDIQAATELDLKLGHHIFDWLKSHDMPLQDMLDIRGFLFSHYDQYGSNVAGQAAPTPQTDTDAQPEGTPVTQSLNTILYGPPGTGKTYATAERAVQICDGEAPADREALMKRYHALREEKRIEFITFHQSYGYEDFVEGLRPQTGPGEDADAADGPGFRLVAEPGVLKRIARQARFRRAGGESFDLAGKRVFKVSLGRHNHPDDQALREECLADGWFMLGWGGEIDWSGPEYDSLEKIAAKWRSQPGRAEVNTKSGDIAQTNSLVRRMRIDDIVLASRGNAHICAIGVVIGPYEFKLRQEDDYHHRRAVNWVWKADDGVGIDVSDLYGRKLTQASIYELVPTEIDTGALAAYLAPADAKAPPPHILIIDEINRANVSKVMGELITLLEEDKREGADNALSVTLPFSKESFSLPANLHILGAMNTADRSIALLDTALRRRFRFEYLGPDPSQLTTVEGVDLPAALRAMNDRLEWLLGPDHLIGHAWFMGKDMTTLAAIDRAMREKVIPLLSEYFHEDLSRVHAVLGGGKGFLKRETLASPPGFDEAYEARHRYVDAWSGGYGAAAWKELIAAKGNAE